MQEIMYKIIALVSNSQNKICTYSHIQLCTYPHSLSLRFPFSSSPFHSCFSFSFMHKWTSKSKLFIQTLNWTLCSQYIAHDIRTRLCYPSHTCRTDRLWDGRQLNIKAMVCHRVLPKFMLQSSLLQCPML